jgi:hypothetical protein
MAASKDDQYSYSSEIGLSGEITHACLEIAARLLKAAYPPTFQLDDLQDLTILRT